MNIEYSKRAAKYISSLDRPTKKRIREGLVLAWDPDYTKVTPSERKRLEEAEQEIINHETVSHNAIDWD